MLVPLASLALHLARSPYHKRSVCYRGCPVFRGLERRPWARRQNACFGTTSFRELEPKQDWDDEQSKWETMYSSKSSASTPWMELSGYDAEVLGTLDDGDEDDRADGPPVAVQVVSWDLDDTLWPTAEVIGAANVALQSFLELAYPAVLAAARRLYVDEGAGGAVPTLMRQLHKARLAADPALPKTPVNLTELRTAALVAAAQEAGLKDAQEVGESCFDAWAAARHQACEALLFPGVVDALGKLRTAGVVLGAITNGNADVEAIPSLKGVFAFCVTAEGCGASKPSPVPFEAAAAAAGVATLGPQ